MNKILFIDDEEEILSSYNRIFYRSDAADSRTKALTGLAQDFFGEDVTEDTDPLTLNFQAYTASQGELGIKIVEEELHTGNPIKVAFIDMRMPPGIGGLETAKRIRALDPKIELVIVTAYSDVDFKQIVKEVGSPDKLLYLKKPFDSQEIKQFALNLTVKYKNETIKDDFISSVSHELKTPLAAILGFQQLLADMPELPLEAKEYLKHLGHSGKLMKALIDELLFSLEIKKKGIILEKKTVIASEFLEMCFKTLRPIFKEREELQFNILIPSELSQEKISLDPTKINHCINNLVNNAVKFTEKGSVTLSLMKYQEKIALLVSDTGIGIPEDKRNFIFDKFCRLEDQHHNVPGLGLGLNIVKDIMDAHKAEIVIESKMGEGSTFKLIF